MSAPFSSSVPSLSGSGAASTPYSIPSCLVVLTGRLPGKLGGTAGGSFSLWPFVGALVDLFSLSIPHSTFCKPLTLCLALFSLNSIPDKPLPIQWQKKAQRSSLLTSKDKVNLYFSPGNAWTRIEDIPSAGMERSSGPTAKGRTHPSKGDGHGPMERLSLEPAILKLEPVILKIDKARSSFFLERLADSDFAESRLRGKKDRFFRFQLADQCQSFPSRFPNKGAFDFYDITPSSAPMDRVKLMQKVYHLVEDSTIRALVESFVLKLQLDKDSNPLDRILGVVQTKRKPTRGLEFEDLSIEDKKEGSSEDSSSSLIPRRFNRDEHRLFYGLGSSLWIHPFIELLRAPFIEVPKEYIEKSLQKYDISLGFGFRFLPGVGLRGLANDQLGKLPSFLVDVISHYNGRYGRFIILVSLGIGCTVWYNYVPGSSFTAPTGDLFAHLDSYDHFFDDSYTQPNLNKVNFIETVDVSDTVDSAFSKELPFTDISIPASCPALKAVGLGLMIAVFLSVERNYRLNSRDYPMITDVDVRNLKLRLSYCSDNGIDGPLYDPIMVSLVQSSLAHFIYIKKYLPDLKDLPDKMPFHPNYIRFRFLDDLVTNKASVSLDSFRLYDFSPGATPMDIDKFMLKGRAVRRWLGLTEGGGVMEV
ncbi:UNVERIFIED_CONTAM: hypothetical protein Scaly_3025700 [Sesamum calycinum]|uniref:Uncharacterized protein n=1 Tax=Sesamum calycinum TaxID=2727403 RepID=A0AAW2K8W0_9LAMI